MNWGAVWVISPLILQAIPGILAMVLFGSPWMMLAASFTIAVSPSPMTT